MVSDLIYYHDTHAFYDKHYHEIEDLRKEFESSIKQPIIPTDLDLKNFLAWFAFEETARSIADRLALSL